MFHVFVTFEVVMYFSELSLRPYECKSRVYCRSCFNITNTEKMGRERDTAACRAGRAPSPCADQGAASVCTQEEARINVVDRKAWTHTLKS